MENLIHLGVTLDVVYNNGSYDVLLLDAAVVCAVEDVSEPFYRPKGTMFALRLSKKIPCTHYPPPQKEFDNVVFCSPVEKSVIYLDCNNQQRAIKVHLTA